MSGSTPTSPRQTATRLFPDQQSASENSLAKDRTVSAAQFAQPETEEMPRPSFLDSNEPNLTITEELEQLRQRVNELEASKAANEDAVRTIIGQSFAQR